MKRSISAYMFYVLIVIGILSVLYFSWISSPRFEHNWLVPRGIAEWADRYENGNIRTAVPLIFLGIFSGILLILKNSSAKWWILVWILLFMLVFLAELGQFFRPSRIFDKGDIKWGVLGASIGLSIMYGLFMFLKLIKVIKKY